MRALDPRLAADTHSIGRLGETRVLLMDRPAFFPWLVLVPDTDETELHRLPAAEREALMAHAWRLAAWVEAAHPVDKMNIAAIGNVVAQLHLHIVPRRHTDPAWPGVVWGHPAEAGLGKDQLASLRAAMSAALSGLTSC